MSTLLGDLEQYSAMDLDPLQGLHRPSSSPIEEQSQRDTGHEEPAGEEREWEDELCQAIFDDNWPKFKQIMDTNHHGLNDEIHSIGKPALLLAAQYGSITIVEELLRLLPSESILTKDFDGFTALTLACFYNGNTEIAKLLVRKNSDLLIILDQDGVLPVAMAFSNHFLEMGRYLYYVTPLEHLEDSVVAHLIISCLRVYCLDIPLELLQNRPKLLVKTCYDEVNIVVVDKIATFNTRIRSRTELSFWECCVYNRINIPPTTPIKHISLDIQQEYSYQQDQAKMIEPGCHGLLQRFINSITNFEGVKKMQELKVLHAQVDALYLLVSKNARKEFALDGIHKALCLAAKEGNVEFVLQVSKGIPEAHLRHFMSDCFSKSLEYRQAKVFNLIHGYRYKNLLMRNASLLHKAAISASDHILNRIHLPTLQIQRELQWFKEVESLLVPSRRGDKNKDGLTPKEIFRQSHKKLMKEGERWITDTASSCSIVGTLIAAITFAAAYTVPGGNDQNHGYPLFIKQPFFMIFIFSTIVSLLSSSTFFLMFLAILTSQYSQEKFLKSLPTKLILGISFLFISIIGMIVAFLSTIYLMLKHTNYSWSLLPIMMLASVPIFLFVVSELPLLYHTYISTYGKIFDRNVKPWP